jgi:prepilin-type N-terminal cleavage/methylation domain-containing protein
MKQLTGKQGFTLIEVIVVLVLLGIMAIALSNVITYGVQSYVFARNADQLSQKAQLATARIKQELVDIAPDPNNPTVNPISFADANRIDYILIQKLPSCTVSSGCPYQYSMKKTGTSITLERTTAPVVAAQVLIDGLTANNGGNNFLSYFRSEGTAWTTADGFKNIKADGSINANYLGTIKVHISLDFPSGGKPPDYQGTINPRANGVFTAPQLN